MTIFFEIDYCDLEKIEEHHREHGYKPKEHGYIEVMQDNVIGALRVTNKACLVAMFVKRKQESLKVPIKWMPTRNKSDLRQNAK